MNFIFALISLALLPATTMPRPPGPNDAASAILAAMIGSDGAAARALYASSGTELDQKSIDELVSQINGGRFANSLAEIVGFETQGDFAIVEINWEYKGHRVWDAMYLVKRDGGWLVFPSDAPTVIVHKIPRNEQGEFRALVDAFEVRRSQRLLGAIPVLPGAASPLEAAKRWQSAVNASDEAALRKLCLQTTLRLIDATEREIVELKRGDFAKGDLVVEAHESTETLSTVIVRARGAAGLSDRRVVNFIRRGETWYVLPQYYGANHSYKEFRDLRRLSEWQLKWSMNPSSRGEAPTPELAAIWASEELPHASAEGNLDRVKGLLERGTPATTEALGKALEHGHAEIADRLDGAAKAADQRFLGGTLLAEAIAQGEQARIEWLLKRGKGRFDKVDLANALYVATEMKDITMVRRLLDAGADPRVIAGHGVPVLFAVFESQNDEELLPAEIRAHIELINILIASGASPLARSEMLKEPLLAAAAVRGRVALVQHLLGLRVFDEPAVEEAFRANLYSPDIKVMETLLDNGADLKSMDRKESVLCGFVYLDHFDVIPWLLDRGADPNARDKSSTALIAAVRRAPADTVKLMLERGGDPKLKDDQGKDAFARADERLAARPESEQAGRIRALLEESRARK